MTTSSAIGGHSPGFAATQRNDRLVGRTFMDGSGLPAVRSLFNVSGLQGEHYYHHGYLSPFYSPVLFTDPSVPGAAPVGTFLVRNRTRVAQVSFPIIYVVLSSDLDLSPVRSRSEPRAITIENSITGPTSFRLPVAR